MRSIKAVTTQQYQNLIYGYFDLLFCTKSKSEQYWCTMIKESITKRFFDPFEPEEIAIDFDLRCCVLTNHLFHRLQFIVGVKISSIFASKFNYHVTSKKQSLFLLSDTLQMTDIEEVLPVVKQMHRLYFEEATVLSKQAKRNSLQHTNSKSEVLFELAHEKFSQIMSIKNDPRSITFFFFCNYF